MATQVADLLVSFRADTRSFDDANRKVQQALARTSTGAKEQAESTDKVAGASAKASKSITDAEKATEAFSRASKKATSGAGDYAKAMSDLDRRATDMGKKVGLAMTVGVTVPLGLAAVASGKFATDFSQSMANVDSIAKLTGKGLADMSRSVLDLSRDKRVTQGPNALAEGLYDVVSSGYKGKAALDIVKEGAYGATAGMTQASVSTKVLTAVLNSHISGVKNARSASDVLFKTVDAGVLTYEQLAASIGRTLSTASRAGVSLQELGAGYALMTRNAIPAAEAATGLNQLILHIADPSKEAKEAMHGMGLTYGFAALQAKGLAGWLEEAARKTQGSEQRLQSIMPDVEGFRALLALTTDDGRAYAGMLGDIGRASNGAGATQEALARQLQGAGAQAALLKKDVEIAAVALGQDLLPVQRDAIEVARSFAQAFGSMDEGSRKAAIGVGLVAASTGPFVSGIAKIAGARLALLELAQASKLASATTGAAGLAAAGAAPGFAALSAAALPWIAGAAAIAAAGYGLYRLYGYLNPSVEAQIRAVQEDARAQYASAQSKSVHATRVAGLYQQIETLSGKTKLSKDETHRLRAALNDLSLLQPDLVRGFDAQGQALAILGGRYDALAKQAADATEAMRKAANAESFAKTVRPLMEARDRAKADYETFKARGFVAGGMAGRGSKGPDPSDPKYNAEVRRLHDAAASLDFQARQALRTQTDLADRSKGYTKADFDASSAFGVRLFDPKDLAQLRLTREAATEHAKAENERRAKERESRRQNTSNSTTRKGGADDGPDLSERIVKAAGAIDKTTGVAASCARYVSEVLVRAGAHVKPTDSAKGLRDALIAAGATAHPASEAKPGDIIVWRGEKYGKQKYSEPDGIKGYHDAVYLGNGKVRGSNGNVARTRAMYDEAHAMAYTPPDPKRARDGSMVGARDGRSAPAKYAEEEYELRKQIALANDASKSASLYYDVQKHHLEGWHEAIANNNPTQAAAIVQAALLNVRLLEQQERAERAAKAHDALAAAWAGLRAAQGTSPLDKAALSLTDGKKRYADLDDEGRRRASVVAQIEGMKESIGLTDRLTEARRRSRDELAAMADKTGFARYVLDSYGKSVGELTEAQKGLAKSAFATNGWAAFWKGIADAAAEATKKQREAAVAGGEARAKMFTELRNKNARLKANTPEDSTAAHVGTYLDEHKDALLGPGQSWQGAVGNIAFVSQMLAQNDALEKGRAYAGSYDQAMKGMQREYLRLADASDAARVRQVEFSESGARVMEHWQAVNVVAFQKVVDAMGKQKEQAREVGNGLGEAFTGAMTDGLNHGFTGFLRALVSNVDAAIRQAVLAKIAAGISGAVTKALGPKTPSVADPGMSGGGGGWWGAFGSVLPSILAASTTGAVKRAGGGPVQGGSPYIVNDATVGPHAEVFVPKSDGNILPADLVASLKAGANRQNESSRGGESRHFHNNQTINVPAAMDRRNQQQVQAAAYRGARQAFEELQ